MRIWLDPDSPPPDLTEWCWCRTLRSFGQLLRVVRLGWREGPLDAVSYRAGIVHDAFPSVTNETAFLTGYLSTVPGDTTIVRRGP